MTTLEEVYNEWQNNLTFRNAFQNDPHAALKEAGFELSASDLQKINNLIKNQHENESLPGRISK